MDEDNEDDEEEAPVTDSLDQDQLDAEAEAAISTLFSLPDEEVVQRMLKMGGVLGLRKIVGWGELAKRKLKESSARR